VGSLVKRALESALAFRPEDRPKQVREWSEELATALTSLTRRNFAMAAGSAGVLLAGGLSPGAAGTKPGRRRPSHRAHGPVRSAV